MFLNLSDNQGIYKGFCKWLLINEDAPLENVLEWLINSENTILMKCLAKFSYLSGDARAIKFLIERRTELPDKYLNMCSPDINWENSESNTTAEVACGSFELGWGNRRRNPFHNVLTDGDLTTVKRLLGTYVKTKSDFLQYVCTSSVESCEEEKIKIVHFLLENVVDINYWEKEYEDNKYYRIFKPSPLIPAIQSKYMEIIDLLISKGINLNYKSMTVAIKMKMFSLMKIHHMSGVKFIDDCDVSCLALACESGCMKIIKYILNIISKYDLFIARISNSMNHLKSLQDSSTIITKVQKKLIKIIKNIKRNSHSYTR